MKQIVDKLNKIAKKIDESVEIPQTDLIIDSLDAITKAYGGTPNDSNLIVDKLEDIYNNIEPAVSGNIEITENGENINVAPFATATVNVQSGILPSSATQKTLDNFSYTCVYDSEYDEYNYESYTLPFIMNIKTGAVNYIYDNTEGTTSCTVTTNGMVSIGDSSLTDTPFYINIRLTEHVINIAGADSNAHHITISFTADGYPILIGTLTNSDDTPYIYKNENENLTKTYYLYLDPFGDGTASRSGVIYANLSNGLPKISIVKFAGGPK